MAVYTVDPIADPRWCELVQHHPLASVFHTVPWLQALERTYAYRPLVFTNSAPGRELENGVAFCKVQSWLTGQRLVSLPFSDHCDALCSSVEELESLLRYLQATKDHKARRYVEFRPAQSCFGKIGGGFRFCSTQRYYLHRIDLQPDTGTLFRNLDKDSIQRRIGRAERARLIEECGNSERLLGDFYRLLVLTRSRHQLPPQPYGWFRNLVTSFGDALEIRVAYKDEIPVAAILTLRFKNTVYYKYGCSDKKFNYLAATPLLLWKAIEAAKLMGAIQFDLGRTDEDNLGLVAFKNKWGANSQLLVYLRYSDSPLEAGDKWKLRFVKRIFAHMPSRLLEATGDLIYRHIG